MFRSVVSLAAAFILLMTFTVVGPALAQCTDCDGDGQPFPADCNDADPLVNSTLMELCDGLDNDCNGQIDDDPSCVTLCAAPDRLGQEVRISSKGWCNKTTGLCVKGRLGQACTTDAACGSGASEPVLVWTGVQFGTAWQQDDSGVGTTQELMFSGFTAAGAGAATSSQVTTNTDSHTPSVVWTGTEYGMSWFDPTGGSSEIYFSRVLPSGSFPTGVCDTGTGLCTQGKVGTSCTVNGNCTGALRVTNDPALSYAPSLVWNGQQQEYGLAWYDARDGNREIYFTRLDAAGGKIGGDIRVTNAAGNSTSPSMVSNGQGYGVAWVDERDQVLGTPLREIYFARLDASGTKIGNDLRVTSAAGFSSAPNLAWSGTEYGVAWQDTRDGGMEIYFAGIDASGSLTLGSSVRITNQPGFSQAPSLAWTGGEFGLAWQDNRTGSNEIYFARITQAGAKLGNDVRLTQNPNPSLSANNSINPSLVWNGQEFGLLWQDKRAADWETFFALLRCDCSINVDIDSATACSDCRDDRPGVFPGALEECDGIDTNCDGPVSPSPDNPLEIDSDGDLFIACSGFINRNVGLLGGNDCSANDPFTFPGALQRCDGNDNTCAGVIPANETDRDGDKFVACTGWNDTQGDNPTTLAGGDCLDLQAGKCTTNGVCAPPGSMPRLCTMGNVGMNCTNSNQCNICTAGLVGSACTSDMSCNPPFLSDSPLTFPGSAPNETNATACMKDSDNDNWGDLNPPAGVTPGTDCNDADNKTAPGTAPNETNSTACMKDTDNDNWGDANPPAGTTPGTDCNDADNGQFPGQTWYPDCDGDSNNGIIAGRFAQAGNEVIACGPAEADTLTNCDSGMPPIGGWRSSPGNDCDDEDPTEFAGQFWYPDCDGDGAFHGTDIRACDLAAANARAITDMTCDDDAPPDGGWTNDDPDGIPGTTDCDDEDASRFPGAAEICGNGIDEDCDGLADDVADGVCDTGTGLCTAGNTGASCTADSDCNLNCVPFAAPAEVTNLNVDVGTVAWQMIPSMLTYHVYRGDLSVLRNQGIYTQNQQQAPNAMQMCGTQISPEGDPFMPPIGEVVFYLVSADDGLLEGSLGYDSSGVPRPNTNPCQ